MATPREVIRFILRSGKRLAILIVGAALLAGGLVMMVTPGPGLLLIVAGLAVLATEFVWAERLLDKAKERASQAKSAVTSRVRRRGKEAEQAEQPDQPDQPDRPESSPSGGA